MREIKFRGKNNGNWVYGYLRKPSNGRCFISYEHDKLWYELEVDPKTIGQYTGLKDATKWEELTEKERDEWTKEGNLPSEWEGKEIYEGDILFIESCFDSETFNIPVIYKEGCFQAEGSGMLSIVCSLNTPKVVGCIHDEVEVIK